MTNAVKRCCRIVLVLLLLVVVADGTAAAASKAKYLFLFIGDGMGVAQRRAAELYLGSLEKQGRSGQTKLLMNTFPAQGLATTCDLTSIIPDSSSAGTAIATGFTTKSGVIGMDAEAKAPYETIAESAKRKGWKVGILTTVSLNHATPAAFYAHVPSRRNMNDIALQLARSGIDYFAGGQLMGEAEKSLPNALEEAKKNGYKIAVGRADLDSLKPGSGKVMAVSATVDQFAAMPFSIDRTADGSGQVTLVEYLVKGTELLENPQGFFIMVEGGRIDWACHANDAASAIHDTLTLDKAVAKAVEFYEKHPDETLIVVTGDHETGGMAIGFAGTRYAFPIEKIRHQKMSGFQFTSRLEEYKKSRNPADARLEDLMPLIHEAFGLYIMSDTKAPLPKAEPANIKPRDGIALNDPEIKILQDAFKQSMVRKEERARDEHTYLLYGSEEPLTASLTRILNRKAGIGWTSYAHTGAPVQTSALGIGAEQFNGYYHQSEIHRKIMAITGLR